MPYRLITLLLCLLFTACGQKGPLVMPEEPREPSQYSAQ